jgi:glycine C-acetyltransferase/8-amino-7-oxononanoate synthase
MRRHRGAGRRLIVTDSVFSMDGDVAPLLELVELAREHGARTIVDEAHATGVLGPDGRGAIAQAGLEGEVDIVIGTLGKALGSYGAYACARRETIRYLINTARPLIFSTAPPPPAVAGALAALELLEQRPHRVRRLRSNARVLRRALSTQGIPARDVEMHIVPVIVGEERDAMRLCEAALARGVFAQAIRPPTVAQGTSRLRLAVMASHTAEELREAAHAIGAAARELGIDLTATTPSRTTRVSGTALEADEPERRVSTLAPAASSSSSSSSLSSSRVSPHEPAPPIGAPFDGERDIVIHRAA